MSDSREPNQLDATEARDLIATGNLTSVDLMESCISQIDRLDPVVNAMITKAYDRARQEAANADQASSKNIITRTFWKVRPKWVIVPYR